MNQNNTTQPLSATQLPSVLAQLLDFQKALTNDSYYADGFEISIDDDKSVLRSWSEHPQFLDRLLPFAQANGAGAFYALWDNGNDQPLDKMPIVAFGDEGGISIIASDSLELLKLLTYDAELSIDDDVYFYKDEDEDQHSPQHYNYLAWAASQFGIEPLTDTEDIIETAQTRYQSSLDQWLQTCC